MREIVVSILICVAIFTAGFLVGANRARMVAPVPLPERILDSNGSRIIERKVEPAPEAIAPDFGEVKSDIRVQAKNMMHPEQLVELHVQEIQTAEGARFVVESPEGWQIVNAQEIRAPYPSAEVRSRRYGIGPVISCDGNGTIKPGMSLVYSSKRFDWIVSGFKNQGNMAVIWRF